MDSGLLLSKVVGYCIVAASCLFKVPQIQKIHKNSSVAGISLFTYLVQLVALTITSFFYFRRDYPFSTYGECIFVWIQDVIITFQMCYYRKIDVSFVIAGIVLYFGIAYTLLVLVPLDVLGVMDICTFPIVLSSLLPQIYSNYNNKSVGQLSLITISMGVVGTLARVFTTVMELDAPLILGMYLLALLLNSTLLLQFWLYGSESKKDK